MCIPSTKIEYHANNASVSISNLLSPFSATDGWRHVIVLHQYARILPSYFLLSSCRTPIAISIKCFFPLLILCFHLGLLSAKLDLEKKSRLIVEAVLISSSLHLAFVPRYSMKILWWWVKHHVTQVGGSTNASLIRCGRPEKAILKNDELNHKEVWLRWDYHEDLHTRRPPARQRLLDVLSPERDLQITSVSIR